MKINLIEPLSISEDLLKSYKEKLESLGHEFNYYLDKATSIEEQKRRVGDCDILMIANSKLPKEAFEENKNLKLINVAFTGFDHVDMEKAKENAISVCNASGYSNTSVSELIIGLVIMIYRKIAEGNFNTRQGNTAASYYKGLEIAGKTVGIVGTGNIGLRTAELFKAFGAKIIAYSRSQKKEAIEMDIEYKSLKEVFKESDIITLHLPNNSQTKGMISRELIYSMKKDAILINCARGPIMDNKALADALNEEVLAFAGIDVFDMEPPIPADYPLLNCKNILLTPHIAFLTDESMIRRAEIAFDNTLSFINGNPKNIVA